jgi:hypothetical protein
MRIGGVTTNLTGGWTVQQARNLTFGLGERFEDVKFLVRDRGLNFTPSFDAVFQAPGPGSCAPLLRHRKLVLGGLITDSRAA